jgi:hypothetical protein
MGKGATPHLTTVARSWQQSTATLQLHPDPGGQADPTVNQGKRCRRSIRGRRNGVDVQTGLWGRRVRLNRRVEVPVAVGVGERAENQERGKRGGDGVGELHNGHLG